MADVPMQLTRHFESLSPKETDEVVGIVAGMIVRYLQAKGQGGTQGAKSAAGKPTEQAEAPTEVRS